MNFNTFHWDIMNEIWAGHLKQRSGLSVCGHFYFMTSNPSRTEQTPVADSAVSTSLSLSKRELNTFQKFRNPLCSTELQESHWETSFAVAGEGLILSYPIFLLGHILFFSSPSPRPFVPFSLFPRPSVLSAHMWIFTLLMSMKKAVGPAVKFADVCHLFLFSTRDRVSPGWSRYWKWQNWQRRNLGPWCCHSQIVVVKNKTHGTSGL